MSGGEAKGRARLNLLGRILIKRRARDPTPRGRIPPETHPLLPAGMCPHLLRKISSPIPPISSLLSYVPTLFINCCQFQGNRFEIRLSNDSITRTSCFATNQSVDHILMLYEDVARPLLTSKKAYLEAFSFFAFDVARNISRVEARAPSRSYPDDPDLVDSISKWISTRGRL